MKEEANTRIEQITKNAHEEAIRFLFANTDIFMTYLSVYKLVYDFFNLTQPKTKNLWCVDWNWVEIFCQMKLDLKFRLQFANHLSDHKFQKWRLNFYKQKYDAIAVGTFDRNVSFQILIIFFVKS